MIATDFSPEIADARFEIWWEDCGVHQDVEKEKARSIFIDGCVVGPAAWLPRVKPQIEQMEQKP
jgi:hypothetical protein